MERRYIVMSVILSIVALMDSLGYTLLVNVLPCMVDVSDPLHYQGVEAMNGGAAYSLLQFSFVFGATVFPAFIGRLSDKQGRRSMLLICLAVVACAYFFQAACQNVWSLAAARFLSGVSGGLRPVAIAYLADAVEVECDRCKLVTSLSFVSAISVGLGPAFGAHLAGLDRSYPFLFVGGASIFCFFLVFMFLPETKEFGSDWPTFDSDTGTSHPTRFGAIYRLLVVLGFITYFMAMTASIAFPLTLKESFQLSPLSAGLCSVFDGPLIFFSNFLFMNKFTTLSKACKASVVASLLFCLIWLVPDSADAGSFATFLSLKYVTSLAGPIVFCAIPQTIISICPNRVCGRFAGLITCCHGAGRLAATLIVGPIFEANPALVYHIVAISGAVSAGVFFALHHRLENALGKVELRTPLMTPLGRTYRSSLSRSLSMMYPVTPSSSSVPIVVKE